MLEAIKSIVSLIRDVAVLGAFGFLLIAPQTTASLLRARGFEHVPTPLGEVDLKAIGGQAGEAELAIEDATGAVTDVDVRQRLEQALTSLKGVNSQVKTGLGKTQNAEADAPVAATAAVPGAPVPAPPPASQGSAERPAWVFAGKVDEAKTGWVPGARKTILESSFPPGKTVTLDDDAYARAATGAANHAQARVIGVFQNGSKIQVDGIDYSRALGGGWFVWLKTGYHGQSAS